MEQEKEYKRFLYMLWGGVGVIFLGCAILLGNASHVKKIDASTYDIADTQQYQTQCDLIEQKRSYTVLRGFCYHKKEKQKTVEGYLVVEHGGAFYQMPTEMLETDILTKNYPQLENINEAEHSGFVAQVSNRYYSEGDRVYLTYKRTNGRKELVLLTVGGGEQS